MDLQRLAKDAESIGGGCQSVYLASNGMFAVQAVEADADTMGNVENLLPGEVVGFIKPEIVIEAARRYQGGLA